MKHAKLLLSKGHLNKFRLKYPLYSRYSIDNIARNVNKILNELTRIYTEQPNGMVLKGIGYFSMLQYEEDLDVDVVYNGSGEDNFVFSPQGGFYVACFYPQVIKNVKLRGFVFAASNKVKKAILEKSDNGMRYVNHSNFLSKLKLNGAKLYKSR